MIDRNPGGDRSTMNSILDSIMIFKRKDEEQRSIGQEGQFYMLYNSSRVILRSHFLPR